MFMGLDQLTALIGLLKEPGGEPVECDAVVEAIRRLLQAAGAEKKQVTQAEAEHALDSSIGENGEKDDGPHVPERTVGSSPPVGTVTLLPDPLLGIQDEENIPHNYLTMFVYEADASLDALTSGLLALERSGGDSELKGLLGTAHKIKGSAASVGLNLAAKLASDGEFVREGGRDGQPALGPDDRCLAQVYGWASPVRGRSERRRP